MRHFTHLKNVSDKLHLSGGAIDLLIGTDFVDALVDIHTVSGEPGEPIAKKKLFRMVRSGIVRVKRLCDI